MGSQYFDPERQCSDKFSAEQSAMLYEITKLRDAIEANGLMPVLTQIMSTDFPHDYDDGTALLGANLFDQMGVIVLHGICASLHDPEGKQRLIAAMQESLLQNHVKVSAGLREQYTDEKGKTWIPHRGPREVQLMDEFIESHGEPDESMYVDRNEQWVSFTDTDRDNAVVSIAGQETFADIIAQHPETIKKIRHFYAQGGTEWDQGTLIPQMTASNHKFHPIASAKVYPALQANNVPTDSCDKNFAYQGKITLGDYDGLVATNHPLASMVYECARHTPEAYWRDYCKPVNPQLGAGAKTWDEVLGDRTWFGKDAPRAEGESDKSYLETQQAYHKDMVKTLVDRGVAPPWHSDEHPEESIRDHATLPQYDVQAVLMMFMNTLAKTYGVLDIDAEDSAYVRLDATSENSGIHGLFTGKTGLNAEAFTEFVKLVQRAPLIYANTAAKALNDGVKAVSNTVDDEKWRYTHTTRLTDDGKWKSEVTRTSLAGISARA